MSFVMGEVKAAAEAASTAGPGRRASGKTGQAETAGGNSFIQQYLSRAYYCVPGTVVFLGM